MAMCAPNPDSCGGTGKCEGSTAELAFEYLTGSSGMYQEYQYSYASYYGA
jgi:cathepsin L